jgi:hypothetical protein
LPSSSSPVLGDGIGAWLRRAWRCSISLGAHQPACRRGRR